MTKTEGNIHKGHRERMKQKVLKGAIKSFSDHELIEYFLFGVYKRKNTNDVAHSIIEHFGDLKGVFEASPDELLSVPDVGPAAAAYISALSELICRYFSEGQPKKNMNIMEDIGEFFIRQLHGKKNECVCILLLDNAMKYIDSRVFDEGSINSARFDMKKLYRYAFGKSASRVIVAHNHPGGVAIPSEADKITTVNLATAFSNLGIDLVEHFVIADSRYIPIMRNSQMFKQRKASEELLRFSDTDRVDSEV